MLQPVTIRSRSDLASVSQKSDFLKNRKFLKTTKFLDAREGWIECTIPLELPQPLRGHYGTLSKKLWGPRRVRIHFFGSVSKKYVIFRNFSKI